MKNYFILILICCVPFVAFSQVKVSKDFDLQVSNPYKVVDAKEKRYFHHKGQIMSVKIVGAKVIIQKFDLKTLKELDRNEQVPFKKRARFEDVVKFGDRFYLLFREGEGDEKEEPLYSMEIDFETGKIIEKKKKLVDVERGLGFARVVSGYSMSFFGNALFFKYRVSFSEDRSKMLVRYRLAPKFKRNSKNFDEIGLCVFDKDLNLLWKETLTMPYTETQMSILDYFVDSNGVCYMVNKVVDDPTKSINRRNGDNPNYHIELFTISPNSKKLDISRITLQEKFINTLALKESNGAIIGGGFYNRGKRPKYADGVFYFKLGSDGNIETVTTHEIPAEILSQYAGSWARMSVKNREKVGKAEFENLIFDDIIPQADGSVLLLGEQFFITTSTSSTSNGGSRSSTTYHYNDVLVTKIAADGSLAWMKKLPKRQQGGRLRGGMSYTVVNDEEKNNIYILFLDNVKNMELLPKKKPATHVDGKGGFYTGFRINKESGDLSKMSIFDTRDLKGMKVYQFNTSRVVGLPDRAFAIELYKKGKEDVLVKIFVND